MTHPVAWGVAETSTITTAAIVVTLLAIAGFVAVGVYRARSSTVREQGYKEMAERSADSARATAAELKGVREELAEVRQRLAALERLLSQIG
jgi:Tfp pilus assembly protein PilN